MRADLDDFGWPETQHGELFSHCMTFFCLAKKKFRIHNRFFFVNSDFFFCQKNVIWCGKSSPCCVLGPSKIIQIDPHRIWKKRVSLVCLFVSACRRTMRAHWNVSCLVPRLATGPSYWHGAGVWLIHHHRRSSACSNMAENLLRYWRKWRRFMFWLHVKNVQKGMFLKW